MGFIEGFLGGLEGVSSWKLRNAMARKAELETQLQEQQLASQGTLKEKLFHPGQTEAFQIPAREVSSGNLKDVIKEARMGPMDSQFGMQMPSVRGYQQATNPSTHDFTQDYSSIRGQRQMPQTFADFVPSRFITRPAAEVQGPGAPVPEYAPKDVNPDAHTPEMYKQILAMQKEGQRPIAPAYQSQEPAYGMEPQLPVMAPAQTVQRQVPGTAGPLAGLSPQMKEIAEALLVQSGGDYAKTATVLNMMAGQEIIPVPHKVGEAGPGNFIYSSDSMGNILPGGVQVPQRQSGMQVVKVPGEPVRILRPDGKSELMLDEAGNPIMVPENPGEQNFGGATGQQIMLVARERFPQEMAALDQQLGRPANFNDLRSAPNDLQAKVNKAWIDQKSKLMGMQQDWILGRNVQQGYEMPLSPEAAAKAGVTPGTTLKEVKNQGLSAMNPVQRQTYADFGTAMNIIEDVGQYAEKIPEVHPGLISRLTEGGRNWANALAQTDENASMLQTKVGELSRMVRALGESGALATKDVDRVIALMPSLFDTKSIRTKKLADIRDLFEKNKANFLNSLGPMPGEKTGQRPTSGKAPSKKEQEMNALYEQEKAKAKQELMQRGGMNGTHP